MDQESDVFEIETESQSDNGAGAKRGRGRPRKNTPKVESDPVPEEAAVAAAPLIKPPTAPAAASPNPSPNRLILDPRKLRLTQDFTKQGSVTKPLVLVPVRKPHRQQFFRVHPDPDFRARSSGFLR